MISREVLRITILTAATLFACVHLSARAESQTSKELESCMDKVDLGAMKNSQWAACYGEELKRQDARLNDAYRFVQRNVPVEAKDALVKAQRSWIAFRDNWCGYEAALPYAPSGEVNRLACLVELTAAQEKKLRGSVI